MTSVREILDHIYTAHCLFCGTGFGLRSELVHHIGECQVYADYRVDTDRMRRELASQSGRAEALETQLRIANETVKALQDKIERMEAK